MECRQLRYFQAIAESLNYRRAAATLGISQPALSQRIKALEESIGVRLFDRSSTGVSLTPAGQSLRHSASRILADVDLAVPAARLADHGDDGTLSNGFNELAGQQPQFAKSLGLFRAAFPHVTVQLAEMGKTRQQEALRAGAIDADFHYRFAGPTDALSRRILDQREFLLALAREHPLNRVEFLTLDNLEGQPMICLRREVNADTYDAIHDSFAYARVSPNIIVEASSDAAMLGLVAAGLGGAIVMRADRRGGFDDIVMRNVEGLTLPKDFVIAWDPANRSAPLAKFLAVTSRAQVNEAIA